MRDGPRDHGVIRPDPVQASAHGVDDESDETAPGAELPPSGRQLVIGQGSTRAVVTGGGGTIREFTVGDETILWPYPRDAISTGGRGQVLFPWPNRIEDGSYEFEGTPAKAPLDEPEHHNAIHGLVRWVSWTVEEESAAAVRLSCETQPQPGYPWRVALSIRYSVSEGELALTAEIVNRSTTTAPVGLGLHPYLDAGEGGVDGCTLVVPADRRLRSDERGLPVGIDDVTGTPRDFQGGAPLAGVQLDDCFTGLDTGRNPGIVHDGTWEVRLTTGDGRRRSVWAEQGWDYVMCYTGDTLPPAEHRKAVAVEPMTCPPNAFRTGESLIVLPPRGRWSRRCGIRSLPPS